MLNEKEITDIVYDSHPYLFNQTFKNYRYVDVGDIIINKYFLCYPESEVNKSQRIPNYSNQFYSNMFNVIYQLFKNNKPTYIKKTYFEYSQIKHFHFYTFEEGERFISKDTQAHNKKLDVHNIVFSLGKISEINQKLLTRLVIPNYVCVSNSPFTGTIVELTVGIIAEILNEYYPKYARKVVAATKIKQCFRRAISNPSYKLCKKRLISESSELNTISSN